jgi:hypothetical protein
MPSPPPSPPSPQPFPNSPPPTSSQDSSAPDVSPGVIVGSSIGVAVVVLVGAFGVLWCVKARKQRRDYSMPTHKGEVAKLGHKKRHQLSSTGSGSTAYFARLFSSKVCVCGSMPVRAAVAG